MLVKCQMIHQYTVHDDHSAEVAKIYPNFSLVNMLTVFITTNDGLETFVKFQWSIMH